MTKPEFISAEKGTRATAHALHVGDRINTMGFEAEALSAIPLAIRAGKSGIAVLFRYGVAVLIGLASEEERDFLETLKPRIDGELASHEEEAATLAFAGEAEDQVLSGGPIQLRDMSPERLLVVADVLAKSVVLAHDERQVAKVFEIIEPFAKELADPRTNPAGPKKGIATDRKCPSRPTQGIRSGRDWGKARCAMGPS